MPRQDFHGFGDGLGSWAGQYGRAFSIIRVVNVFCNKALCTLENLNVLHSLGTGFTWIGRVNALAV